MSALAVDSEFVHAVKHSKVQESTEPTHLTKPKIALSWRTKPYDHNNLPPPQFTHLKIGRTAAQALHIHPPLLPIQPERLQRPPLTQRLDPIDILVPAVIPRAGISLAVLIGQHAPQRVEDGPAREVLGRDEDEGRALTRLLAFD